MKTHDNQSASVARRVLGWPEAAAHYSLGSILLVTHLLTVGIRLHRRPAHG